jgi:3',5'-cyclic-AMP phosphodiesterase
MLGRFSAAMALLLIGTLAGCSATVGPTPQSSGTTEVPTPAASTTTGLHFAVASDGHFGEPGTDSANRFTALVTALNAANRASGLDFVVINGDISHGGVALAEQAKAALDQLQMPYFVAKGNHDELTEAEWQQVWGTPGNQVHRFGDRSIVLLDTSNAAGDYLCADTTSLTEALRTEASQRDVFVFFHITPKKWTKHGIDCPPVRSQLASAPNVRAVFNAHDHDQLSTKTDAGLAYLFDGHFGGSWGAPDRSFRDVVVAEGTLTTRLLSLDGQELSRDSLHW